MARCTTCKEEGVYSVMLATGSHGDRGLKHDRFYIPNQIGREQGEIGHATWFCKKCMRTVEDNLRATILYLMAEKKMVNIDPRA